MPRGLQAHPLRRLPGQSTVDTYAGRWRSRAILITRKTTSHPSSPCLSCLKGGPSPEPCPSRCRRIEFFRCSDSAIGIARSLTRATLVRSPPRGDTHAYYTRGVSCVRFDQCLSGKRNGCGGPQPTVFGVLLDGRLIPHHAPQLIACQPLKVATGHIGRCRHSSSPHHASRFPISRRENSGHGQGAGRRHRHGHGCARPGHGDRPRGRVDRHPSVGRQTLAPSPRIGLDDRSPGGTRSVIAE